MTTKQKKVLDFMIEWAENEIHSDCYYDSTKRLQVEALAKGGPVAMYDLGGAMFYGLQEAGYSFRYINDAAYGNYGCSQQVLKAIEQPFKDHFMGKYENREA